MPAESGGDPSSKRAIFRSIFYLTMGSWRFFLFGALTISSMTESTSLIRGKRTSALIPFQGAGRSDTHANNIVTSAEKFSGQFYPPAPSSSIGGTTATLFSSNNYQRLNNVDPPSEASMIFAQTNSSPPNPPAGLVLADNGVTQDVGQLSDQVAHLQHELGDAKQRLNQTDIVIRSFKELVRLMQNNDEVYKLENAQLSRLYNEEKLKARMRHTELIETRKLLHQAEQRLNGTVNNAQDPLAWDVKETVYNGEAWLQNWDGLEPPLGTPSNVTATRVIVLLRHGHYEYSEPEEFIRMSALGAQQMEALGQHLGSLKYRWNKAFVHSSKFRTQHAAQIVAKYIPGLELEPSDVIWSVAYDNDSERRQEAFKEFIHRASPEQKHTSYELIMTHSSVIRYFVDRALQIPFGAISMPLAHGSVTRLEIPPDGRVVLKEYGEFSHMPKNLLTASNAKWLPNDSGNATAPQTARVR